PSTPPNSSPAAKSMASASPNLEIEVKIALASIPGLRQKLRGLGFHLLHRRVLEVNVVLDTVDKSLLGSRCMLRLRRAGSRHVLTFKGPPAVGVHKTREELELSVSDLDGMQAILSRLGYAPAFRYEKYRTEYSQKSGKGVLQIDETPVGNFLELEGSPRWIDRTARALGFRSADYITCSYGEIYRKYCAARGIEPSHMVFK
ncbi:MAG: class IV adenylate cyclase, partial [Bryobacteraceae bacterium]